MTIVPARMLIAVPLPLSGAVSPAAAAPSCPPYGALVRQVEACQRELTLRHLCSGMKPAAFEALVTNRCRAVRQRVRPCLVRHYSRVEKLPAVQARSGADEELAAGIGLEVNVYTAKFEGRLKDPHFKCRP